MNPVALQALEESIQVWEHKLDLAITRRVDEISFGRANCPLCQVNTQYMCEGCPVTDAAKAHSCQRTPYGAAYRAVDSYRYFRRIGGDLTEPHRKMVYFVREELEFLKSLLPEELADD